MCDFRDIKQITFFTNAEVPDELSGTVLDITETLRARAYTSVIPGQEDVPYFTQVEEPGFYHIGASGSWHSYYTGEMWLREDVHYTVSKFKEWRHH